MNDIFFRRVGLTTAPPFSSDANLLIWSPLPIKISTPYHLSLDQSRMPSFFKIRTPPTPPPGGMRLRLLRRDGAPLQRFMLNRLPADLGMVRLGLFTAQTYCSFLEFVFSADLRTSSVCELLTILTHLFLKRSPACLRIKVFSRSLLLALLPLFF